MTRMRTPLAWTSALALSLTLGLGGCVTVFPKTKAVQMYRFDYQAPADTPPPGPSITPPISIGRAPTSFARGADTDRIMTARGDTVAYIAGGRWATPAASLFDMAESQAFDLGAPRLRLDRRGELSAAPYVLRVDVEKFETDYDGDGPPTVVVRLEASLTRTLDRKIMAVNTLESRQPAKENRVGAIVAAYDAAVTDSLGKLASWTDSQVQVTTP